MIRSLILRAYSAPLDFELDNHRHWDQLEGLKVAVLTLAPETSGTPLLKSCHQMTMNSGVGTWQYGCSGQPALPPLRSGFFIGGQGIRHPSGRSQIALNAYHAKLYTEDAHTDAEPPHARHRS